MSNNTQKLCKKCDMAKSFTEFSPAKSNKDGLLSWCKPCAALHAKALRLADPLLSRRSLLKSRYGITLEQYAEKLEQQGGVCAICKGSPKSMPLHVDHDHSCCPGKKTCGKCLRSLLCTYCNNFLGKLESPNLSKFLDYLRRWENE